MEIKVIFTALLLAISNILGYSNGSPDLYSALRGDTLRMARTSALPPVELLEYYKAIEDESGVKSMLLIGNDTDGETVWVGDILYFAHSGRNFVIIHKLPASFYEAIIFSNGVFRTITLARFNLKAKSYDVTDGKIIVAESEEWKDGDKSKFVWIFKFYDNGDFRKYDGYYCILKDGKYQPDYQLKLMGDSLVILKNGITDMILK